MYAKLYKQDADQAEDIQPADGKSFTLAELQGYVDGYIEVINLPSGRIMVLNEESKLQADPVVNFGATLVWQSEFPIKEYPHNNDSTVCGHAIVCDSELVQ